MSSPTLAPARRQRRLWSRRRRRLLSSRRLVHACQLAVAETPLVRQQPHDAPQAVLDYAFVRYDPALIVAKGYTGVCRYIAPDNSLTHGKILFAPELAALHAALLKVWPNFEWYESRPTEGAAAGHADGLLYVAAVRALGFPQGTVLPWSFDQLGTFADCAAYAQAIAAVIRANGYRPGMYGGSVAGHALLDAGLIDVFWQAEAMSWSNYQISTRAALRQIYGANVFPSTDHNVETAPLGAWGPSGLDTTSIATPTPTPDSGDDVPYILQDNGAVSSPRGNGAWAPWEAHVVENGTVMHIVNDDLLNRMQYGCDATGKPLTQPGAEGTMLTIRRHPDDYAALVAMNVTGNQRLTADQIAALINPHTDAARAVIDAEIKGLAAIVQANAGSGVVPPPVNPTVTGPVDLTDASVAKVAQAAGSAASNPVLAVLNKIFNLGSAA